MERDSQLQQTVVPDRTSVPVIQRDPETVGETTAERLFRNYNTYSRRPTVRDVHARKVMFRAFRRVLGPWLPRNPSARILDVACGEGALLAFLYDAGYVNLDGYDLSPENVAICHELGLKFVRRFDALQLTGFLSDRRYDAIFAIDIIEHLPKSRIVGFMEMIRSLLLPGGYVVIQTPNMGSLYGCYHRYNDLSHEFGLTEKTVLDLFMMSGFRPNAIAIRAAWNATTLLGRFREVYVWLLHHVLFAGEGPSRPRIPTKNLLVRGSIE